MNSNTMQDDQLDSFIDTRDLKSLNDSLTQLMKNQQIQPIIKGDNLKKLVDIVIKLSSVSQMKENLFAGAILGRLAAVARGRETEVYSRVSELFPQEPQSIETLSDGDEKEYAAKVLAYVNASWLIDYCSRESLVIDAANNARKELLRIVLTQSDSITDAIIHITNAQEVIKSIESIDTRMRRVRRIFESFVEISRNYDGDVGQEPGATLSACVDSFLRGAISTDTEILHASLDAALSILVRMIELRFSYALHSETYQLLQNGKKLLTGGRWAQFISSSSVIHKVQMNLLETALVLARQNRTDKEILRAMEASWQSTTVISTAIKRHFKGAVDIDPEVADYWMKLGRVTQSASPVEHRLSNHEDQQIGELLIQLDANRDCMDKLNSAVVPILKTFDHYQAATVRRAAMGYESIAQVAERLARMRRLSKTDSLGRVVEYNPIEHDMEGGHRSGIRNVKVVRDGILKEFGGKKKMLVKLRVEPQE